MRELTLTEFKKLSKEDMVDRDSIEVTYNGETVGFFVAKPAFEMQFKIYNYCNLIDSGKPKPKVKKEPPKYTPQRDKDGNLLRAEPMRWLKRTTYLNERGEIQTDYEPIDEEPQGIGEVPEESNDKGEEETCLSSQTNNENSCTGSLKVA